MPVLEMPTRATTAPPDIETVQCFIFWDADWALYQGISNALGGRRVRLTYDGGRMELMTLSRRHERFSSLLDRFLTY